MIKRELGGGEAEFKGRSEEEERWTKMKQQGGETRVRKGKTDGKERIESGKGRKEKLWV